MTQDGGSDSPYCGPTENTACATIQQAIDNISPSSHDENVTVCVLSMMGTSYPCPEGGEGVSIINKSSLSLRASGPGVVTMDCQGRGRALFLRNVTYFALQGFVIQNGRADQGGGVLAIDVGELYLLDDVFDNNVATLGWGGALNAYNVNTLGIGRSYFGDNVATGSNATGGGVLAQGVASLEIWDTGFGNNSVVGNDSLGGGAISILSGDAVNIRGCKFSDNVAQLSDGIGGGALLVGDVNVLAVEGCRFENNAAHGEGATGGGAICASPPVLSPRIYIRASELVGNTASGSVNGGGAIAIGYASLLRIEASNFTNNVANISAGGGAIYSYGNEVFRVSSCRFVGNLIDSGRENDYLDSYGGGAIVSDESDLYVEDTTFEDNISVENLGGGAIIVVGKYSSVNAHVVDCAFRNNAAMNGVGGGAIYADGGPTFDMKLTVIHTAFQDNRAHQGQGIGGAICSGNLSEMELLGGTTFVGNSATNGGGAVYASLVPTLSIVNITGASFSHNRAEGGGGGAVSLFEVFLVAIAHSNFTHNAVPSGFGGAVFMNNKTMQVDIEACLFAHNNASSGGALYIYTNTTHTVNLVGNCFRANVAGHMGKTTN